MKCSEKDCLKDVCAKGLCSMHYRRKQRAERPELRAASVAYTKQWKAEHPTEHAAQQARKHKRQKDKLNAYTAKWKKENWAYYKTYLAARKHRVKQATPPWIDMATVEAMYANRQEGYEIDHIIPLNHPDVSGLNVPWNLQYLTEKENSHKNNKFDGTYENEGWRKTLS